MTAMLWLAVALVPLAGCGSGESTSTDRRATSTSSSPTYRQGLYAVRYIVTGAARDAERVRRATRRREAGGAMISIFDAHRALARNVAGLSAPADARPATAKLVTGARDLAEEMNVTLARVVQARTVEGMRRVLAQTLRDSPGARQIEEALSELTRRGYVTGSWPAQEVSLLEKLGWRRAS